MKTNKRSTGRRGCGWGCAALLVLAACSLIFLAPVALRLVAYVIDNWPATPMVLFGTDTPEPPLATDTPAPHVVGALTVTGDGGTFENDEITIDVPAGAVSEPVEFTVTKLDPPPLEDEEQFYQSPLYRLEGPVGLLNGDLTFTLKLPPEAFAEEGGTLSVVLLDEGFAPSAGEMVTARYRLPSEVDADAQTITAILSLAAPEGIGQSSRALASLDTFTPPRQDVPTDDAITITVEGRWCGTEVRSEHFLVTYSGCAIETALVSELAEMLEDQRAKLEGLGFSFADLPDPVYVYLEKFAATSGQPRAGQFNPSKRGAGYCSLSFNRYYFLTEPWSAAERADLQATAGHELFHFVQFVYDPRWAYTKAVSPEPTLWLDEAASTWYEPTALDDPEFLPSNATSNSGFIRTPLYLAPVDEATGHGYGASLFLRYLTDKYDDFLIAEAYDQLRAGVYSETAAEALDEALTARNSSVGMEWVPFLETYFVRPGEITPAFGGPDVSKWINPVATANADGTDYEISFETAKPLDENQPTITKGMLVAGPEATVSLQFTLGNLSADAFRLLFDLKKGDTAKAFNAPGQLRVTVNAPEWSGVLVYGIPREGGTEVPLAGAPWGFLSSGDSASETGSEIVVSGLSHASGQGQYKGLLFVPFQYRSSSFTTSRPATVQITLAYLAALPAGPTPTPAAASTVCAGLAPDDVRHPGLNQQAMQCNLACIPIGGPEPSGDQLWACIEANGGQRP